MIKYQFWFRRLSSRDLVGSHLKCQQTTFRLPYRPEPSLHVGPAPYIATTHPCWLNLPLVNKCNYAEIRRVAKDVASCGKRLANKMRSGASTFVSKSTAHPRTGPLMLHVLSERPGSDPKRFPTMCLSIKNDTPTRRNELRRADFLPVVVTIGKLSGFGVGAMRKSPYHDPVIVVHWTTND